MCLDRHFPGALSDLELPLLSSIIRLTRKMRGRRGSHTASAESTMLDKTP